MSMVKIYRGDFRKDYLGLTLVIGSLGALLIIMPLVVFYLWIGNEVNSGISLSDIALNAGFFLVLFLAGSCACFYLIWRGVNERGSSATAP